MTGATDTLLTALEACDMIEIDGLHAFDFTLDDAQLRIECMDGRAAKQWRFSLAEVQAATFDPTLQSWTITADTGEHRLVCLSAFSASNDDDDTDEPA